MCGFIGEISKYKNDDALISYCNKSIECRGPDEKVYLNKSFSELFNTNLEYSINAIFNRLSIIDLTEKGSQPMFSKDYNTAIFFNGEIFNHSELRKWMESDSKFYSNNSDTEVLLIGLSKYGESFIKKCNGQFSLIFLDLNKNEIILIRDRLGQKPLFYFNNEETLAFSSNLISLSKLTNQKKIKDAEIHNFIKDGVIVSPNTIFENIFKLEPGKILKFKLSNKIKIQKEIEYWNQNSFLSEKAFDKEEFFQIFKNSVRIRSQSDVENAYFLSGGLDSTSVIKSAKDLGITNINSFSVITDDNNFDESEYSNKVAEKYNTNHHTENVSINFDFEYVIESLDSIDELYFDPSIVPTYLLCQKIANNYKVAISGDGGDELLAGYSRLKYVFTNPKFFQKAFSRLETIYPPVLGTGSNFKKYSSNFSDRLLGFHSDVNLAKLIGFDYDSNLNSLIRTNKNSLIKSVLDFEYNFFLKEMMLLKIDRASMANSLEVRSPFVDHRLIEYIFSHNIDSFYKNEPKFLLKNYLSNDFDNAFLSRKKKGFNINLSKWIYNNIHEVNDYLSGSEIIFNNKSIIKNLSIYKSRINGLRIFKLLTLENYLKKIKN